MWGDLSNNYVIGGAQNIGTYNDITDGHDITVGKHKRDIGKKRKKHRSLPTQTRFVLTF